MLEFDLETAKEVQAFCPTEEFWVQWRKRKKEIKAKGYGVLRIAKNWYVIKVDKEDIFKKQLQIEYALIEAI